MAWNTWNGNGGYNRNYPNYQNNGGYNNNGYNNNGGNYNRPQKPKYSNSEKMAYNSGIGYVLAVENRGINFDTDKMQDSFKAGYKYGKKLIERKPDKYFDKNKSKKK